MLGAVAAFVACAPDVGAQSVSRLYGTYNGDPIALLANSSGLLRVVVAGGAFTTPFTGPAGNCTTAPAYSFTGDANTGMSSPSADELCFPAGGTSRLNISSTAVTSSVPFKLAGSTSGTITLQAPAVAGSPTYTLPAAIGAAGQVLTDAAGNGVLSWAAGGGGGGAPTDATYITQTTNATLSAEQALSALATGLVKNTTGTGVLSIAAAGTDYLAPYPATCAALTGIAVTATPAILECVNGTTVGTWAVPTGGSGTSNFLNMTWTLPTTPTAIVRGMYVLATSAGSAAFAQNTAQVELTVGYTGSSATRAMLVLNNAASTGTGMWTGSATAGNYGFQASASGVTSGHNAGATGVGSGSSTLNFGGRFLAISATNTPALNLGVGSLALNGTLNVGGFFGLMATAPTFASSAALIADNGAVAADIFEARDNGTVVISIADGGALIFNTDNSYDIGASGATRPRTGYFGTSIVVPTVTASAAITSSSATAGIGYATGAGGTVTQATSRVTGVTLNKITGDITLVSAVGSAVPLSFVVTNSTVAAVDNVVVGQKSGTDSYQVFVTAVGAGSFTITFMTTGGVTTEQPVFHFSIVKGVSS